MSALLLHTRLHICAMFAAICMRMCVHVSVCVCVCERSCTNESIKVQTDSETVARSIPSFCVRRPHNVEVYGQQVLDPRTCTSRQPSTCHANRLPATIAGGMRGHLAGPYVSAELQQVVAVSLRCCDKAPRTHIHTIHFNEHAPKRLSVFERRWILPHRCFARRQTHTHTDRYTNVGHLHFGDGAIVCV